MESGQQVSECDLVLGHEVVYDDHPLPERRHTHDKEVMSKEEVKHFLSPRLPGYLEATE